MSCLVLSCLTITTSCKEEDKELKRFDTSDALSTLQKVIDDSDNCIEDDAFIDLSQAISVGTTIHLNKPEGYYCPLNDCNAYNEFHDHYLSTLDELEAPLFMDHFEDCESFFARPINTHIFNKDYQKIKEYVDNTLAALKSDNYITTEEFVLMESFFNEGLVTKIDNLDELDFCYYKNQLNDLDLSTSRTNGMLSENLYAITPLILEDRMDLLSTWFDGTNPDDIQGVVAYGLLAGLRFFGGFAYEVYSKGLDDPTAGNCGLAGGVKAVAYGI